MNTDQNVNTPENAENEDKKVVEIPKKEEKELIEKLESGNKYKLTFDFRSEIQRLAQTFGDDRDKKIKSVFETYREFSEKDPELKREMELQKLWLDKEGIFVFGEPDSNLIDLTKKNKMRAELEKEQSTDNEVLVETAQEMKKHLWSAVQEIIYNLKISDFNDQKFEKILFEMAKCQITNVQMKKCALMGWLFSTNFEQKLPEGYNSFTLNMINEVRENYFKRCKKSNDPLSLCSKEQLKILDLALNGEKKKWLKNQGL